MQAIRLIVGLGNPGNQYAQTRHNAGFWFVDELARRGSADWHSELRFKAEICRLQMVSERIWLMKPQTFMNCSGQAVQALTHYYRIPIQSVLVVHDEIDLPVGTTRLKKDGGHAGHNGLRDIIVCMGRTFWRLRIGVGHPGNKAEVTDYVLQRPSTADQIDIERDIGAAASVIEDVVSGCLERAMRKLHTVA